MKCGDTMKNIWMHFTIHGERQLAEFGNPYGMHNNLAFNCLYCVCIYLVVCWYCVFSWYLHIHV